MIYVVTSVKSVPIVIRSVGPRQYAGYKKNTLSNVDINYSIWTYKGHLINTKLPWNLICEGDPPLYRYVILRQVYNSQEYFYDITNNTWVTHFLPSLPSSPTPIPASTPTSTPSLSSKVLQNGKKA
ncbi:hypothetical protein Glove_262g57 [Diversispora epigaea]|uniref:Uncharacterized protein n=1 Tax=Diversispora epigaea TaxID=1348612 RepID=A0A397I5T6_9GLOM|nr:hypothetical protein Glove_262g57 [Diversispora epigaea]